MLSNNTAKQLENSNVLFATTNLPGSRTYVNISMLITRHRRQFSANTKKIQQKSSLKMRVCLFRIYMKNTDLIFAILLEYKPIHAEAGFPPSHKTCCAHCGKVFKGPKHLKNHINEQHLKTTEMFECPLCETYKSPRMTNLRKHFNEQHGTTKKMQNILQNFEKNPKTVTVENKSILNINIIMPL